MSTVTQCDRCGEIITQPSPRDSAVHYAHLGYSCDLCVKCFREAREAFEKFMGKKVFDLKKGA
jgi:hypothetical protein